MAITTLDGVVAGLQVPQIITKGSTLASASNRMYSTFYTPGTPGAAIAPTPGIAGAALTSYAGQIPFVNGADDQYLAVFQAGYSGTGTMILADRLWHNSGIVVTTTTEQTINSVAWPARDKNGAVDGEGVFVGLEISTTMGAGVSVLSLNYTNSNGDPGRTGTCRFLQAATAPVGTFWDFMLEAGDTGVQSIEGFTSPTSMTAGAVHLVAYRILAKVASPTTFGESTADVLGAGMVKMYNDTVPFLLINTGTAATLSHVGATFIQTNG